MCHRLVVDVDDDEEVVGGDVGAGDRLELGDCVRDGHLSASSAYERVAVERGAEGDGDGVEVVHTTLVGVCRVRVSTSMNCTTGMSEVMRERDDRAGDRDDFAARSVLDSWRGGGNAVVVSTVKRTVW